MITEIRSCNFSDAKTELHNLFLFLCIWWHNLKWQSVKIIATEIIFTIIENIKTENVK